MELASSVTTTRGRPAFSLELFLELATIPVHFAACWDTSSVRCVLIYNFVAAPVKLGTLVFGPSDGG